MQILRVTQSLEKINKKKPILPGHCEQQRNTQRNEDYCQLPKNKNKITYIYSGDEHYRSYQSEKIKTADMKRIIAPKKLCYIFTCTGLPLLIAKAKEITKTVAVVIIPPL